MNGYGVAWIVGAYLLGSIPTGLWLGQLWKRVDVRTQGSGNLGATNVYRVLGPTPAAITLVIDVLKGLLPVLACKHALPENVTLPVLVGVAAIAGHVTSIFVRFRGGKGVATSAGVFTALLPWPSLVAFGLFAGTFAVTRIVSLSSLLAVTALAVTATWWSPTPLLKSAAITAAIFVIWTHRSNIKRLRAGTEQPLGRNA